MPKRVLRGTVISDRNNKTVLVKVERKYRHPLYKKVLTRSKKFSAHDEKEMFKEGDIVSIIESKPFSKSKKFEVVYSR